MSDINFQEFASWLSQLSAWMGIIGVSVIGLVVYFRRLISAWHAKCRLERYLRDRKLNHPNSYQHTIDHLLIHTQLSRDQIETAARRSKKVKLIPRQDRRGMATGHLFEYIGS